MKKIIPFVAFVIGAFLGQPQVFYAIASSVCGSPQPGRPLTSREEALAADLAEILSRNRGGLWLFVGLIACVMALVVRAYA